MPARAWTWRQTWCDLLFAHWPIAASRLRALVPDVLEIEEFDGVSWVGVVPFRMQGVMRRPLPDLPYVSAFPEMNVRLYVRYQDKPGVWFVSLDAGNALAVWAARTSFHLPYFRASMRANDRRGWVEYRSERRWNGPHVGFRGRFRPASEIGVSARGSLDYFLTERYCLYASRSDGALFRTEVHHRPWPLQRAEAVIEQNSAATAQGIQVSGAPVTLHFSRRLDVVVFPPERIS